MIDKNNAVLITGANGGIGSALCDEFSKAGYFIIASDTGKDGTEYDEYVQADLNALVQDVVYRNTTLQNIATALVGKQLSAIINNAAVQILGNTEELNITDFQTSMNVNVTAPLILIKTFLPELTVAGGAVVNIGSIHTRLTKPGFVSYACSKSALDGLSQSLAIDLGDK